MLITYICGLFPSIFPMAVLDGLKKKHILEEWILLPPGDSEVGYIFEMLPPCKRSLLSNRKFVASPKITQNSYNKRNYIMLLKSQLKNLFTACIEN